MRSISSLLGSGDVVEGKGKFHERKTEISHLFSHLVREVIKLPGKNTLGGVSVISKTTYLTTNMFFE